MVSPNRAGRLGLQGVGGERRGRVKEQQECGFIDARNNVKSNRNWPVHRHTGLWGFRWGSTRREAKGGSGGRGRQEKR